MTLPATEGTVVIDLDGVVWLAGEPLPGATDAVQLLRERGYDVLFATNNSSPTRADLAQRLGRIDIEAAPEAIVTAATAAAACVPEGSTTLLVGEAGVREAASERGLVEGTDPTAVIVGWNRDFTFETIAEAATAVRDGALFVATNDDPTHPTGNGLLPGTGALVAAVATASECIPIIAGKPGEAMAALVQSGASNISLMVGDRPSTDGAFSQRLGVPFGLVISQATPSVPSFTRFRSESLFGVITAFLQDAGT